MTRQDDTATAAGAAGAQIKQRIADAKRDSKTEPVDVGAAMLGTDDEAGAPPDAGGMAQARKAPAP